MPLASILPAGILNSWITGAQCTRQSGGLAVRARDCLRSASPSLAPRRDAKAVSREPLVECGGRRPRCWRRSDHSAHGAIAGWGGTQRATLAVFEVSPTRKDTARRCLRPGDMGRPAGSDTIPGDSACKGLEHFPSCGTEADRVDLSLGSVRSARPTDVTRIIRR